MARDAELVRIYGDRTDHKLTATRAGPAMDHIAHLLAWAIERGETASSLLSLPFYHPAFEEGLKTARRQICKQADNHIAADDDEFASSGA